MLNSSGRISVWDERRGGQAIFNCIFNVSRDISVADIAVSGKTGGLLIIAKDGTGFEGVHQVSCLAKALHLLSLAFMYV